MANIKVVKADGDYFEVKVNDNNFKHVRLLLIKEREKIIDKLKEYHQAGLIGSVKKPRNPQMQKILDILVEKKKVIKNSIKQINKIFL